MENETKNKDKIVKLIDTVYIQNESKNVVVINKIQSSKMYERFDDYGDNKPDISFIRVGGNSGLIDYTIENKSFQSHYFIKFNVQLTDELKETLSNIHFNSKDDTCGPKSISKQELIEEFNKII